MKNSWEKQQDGVIFKKMCIWDTLTRMYASVEFWFIYSEFHVEFNNHSPMNCNDPQ